MLIRNHFFAVAILFSSISSWNAAADNLALKKTQTEVLAATLAELNLSDPTADLKANIATGDRRFIGINSYTCSAPGVITDEDERLAVSMKFGLRCLAGTSDVLESNEQKALVDKALKYARTYNSELLRRIHAGLI